MLGEPQPAPAANGIPMVEGTSASQQQQPNPNIPFQHR